MCVCVCVCGGGGGGVVCMTVCGGRLCDCVCVTVWGTNSQAVIERLINPIRHIPHLLLGNQDMSLYNRWSNHCT